MQQGAVLAMLAKEPATGTSCGPGCGTRSARSETR